MHLIMKHTLLILLAIAASLTLHAQKISYEHKSFTSQDGTELKYRLLTPPDNAHGKKFPLVVFLHGAGERGSDNEKQLIHGSQMFLNPTNREKFPAYVIFPQCPEDKYWAFSKRPSSFYEMTAEETATPLLLAVKDFVDSYLTNPTVGASRVYIMGLSMGGMATYDLASR